MTAGLSVILALILVVAAGSALASVLGDAGIGSSTVPTGPVPQLSLSDLETVFRTLVAFAGYIFFASQLTPVEVSGLGGATYAILGVGSASIALIAILLPFGFARRAERALPSSDAGAAMARGFAIAAPYWVGALAMYLLSSISLGSSLFGFAIHPSGLGLVLPTLLVGIGGALGGVSIRPPTQDAAISVFRGFGRSSVAIVVGIGATIVIVSAIYAFNSISGGSPTSSTGSGSLPTSAASSALGWSLLAMVPFYLFNGAGAVWTAVLGGGLFKDTAVFPLLYLGPALGALVGAILLRRAPDRIEQAAFASAFGLASGLIAVATTPAIINGPSALPAPSTVLLAALAFGVVAALAGPYLASLGAIRAIPAKPPLRWIVGPILSMWPPGDVVAGDRAVASERPIRLGRREAVLAVALITLVAIGFVGNAELSSQFSPQQAALAYLDAQRRGDADAMWSIVTYESLTGTSTAMLSKAALTKMLAESANRAISNAEVTDVSRIDDANATVKVQMNLAGQAATMSLHLRKDAGKTNWLVYPYWKVVIPASTIAVTTYLHAGSVTVDGFDSGLTDTSGSLEVIPGSHAVVMASTDIFEGATQIVNASADTAVTFTSTLNVAASNAVNKTIKTLFTKCAATHQLETAGCPNSGYAFGDHRSGVKWTLVGDPTSNMQLAIGDAIDTITASGQWKMHVAYTYWYDFDPSFVQHESDDIEGYFDDTLHWNGSGFDITNQSGY